jgi:hypothetical protein
MKTQPIPAIFLIKQTPIRDGEDRVDDQAFAADN